MAFVGYSYIHDCTAQVQYPGAEGNPGVVAKEVRSGNSDRVNVLESEIKDLKQTCADEREKKLKHEATIAALEIQKTQLESNSRQLKSVQEKLQNENKELTGKIDGLQQTQSGSLNNTKLIQELTEVKLRLEGEIARLSAELRSQKEENMTGQLLISEYTKSKDSLGEKIGELTEMVKNLQAERDLLLEKSVSNSTAVGQKSQELLDLTNKLTKANSDISSINAELKLKSEAIQEKLIHIEEQNQAISVLEKENISLKIDHESLVKKLQDAETEKSQVSAQLNDLRSTAQKPNDEESNAFKIQIEQANKLREKSEAEASLIKKSKAMLEVELNALTKSKNAYQKANDEASEKLILMENKYVDIAKELDILQTEKSALDYKYARLEAELTQIKSVQSDFESTKKELEKQKAEFGGLSVKHERLNAQFNLEKELAISLQQKIHQLENEISAERKARISLDAENTSQIEENLKLNDSYLQQKLRTETFSTRVGELEDELATLQTNHRILKMNKDNEADINEKNAELIAELESQLRAVRNELDVKTNAVRDTLDQLENSNLLIVGLEKDMFAFRSKELHMNDRIDELEKENEVLKTKLESSQGPPSAAGRMLDPPDKRKGGPAEKNLFSRSRMSGMFFKSRENMPDIPSSPPPIGEEESNHIRNRSHQSFGSDKSGTTAKALQILTSNAPPLTGIIKINLVLDFFNPMDGLSGWIKVPKGGKVKKGWKRIYLAVSQSKLFTYETLEDFQIENGIMICDLSCEIFVARSVSQNELIHANAKDIDMIFKIQALAHNNRVGTNAEEVCCKLILG